MSQLRVGLGLDAHRFGGTPPLVLGGVIVDQERGLDATSDGDAVAHAVSDALLGAVGLGDMGTHFPSTDDRWQGADSMSMLVTVVKLVRASGWWVNNVDVTIVAQDVRIDPHREAMREALSDVLETRAVSVKATTTDTMGFTGRGEGLAALAVVTVTI
ncbi:MAG TPA: 2-C-methyl-D-erythritol 2,4-cyclodiphosphate synthase [Acidimicrobiia bacterium]|nr:2-C-methyl-D-erythritol 2,4-cyclodiphosphate synthase [Acidimicrobiia bacterium]